MKVELDTLGQQSTPIHIGNSPDDLPFRSFSGESSGGSNYTMALNGSGPSHDIAGSSSLAVSNRPGPSQIAAAMNSSEESNQHQPGPSYHASDETEAQNAMSSDLSSIAFDLSSGTQQVMDEVIDELLAEENIVIN